MAKVTLFTVFFTTIYTIYINIIASTTQRLLKTHKSQKVDITVTISKYMSWMEIFGFILKLLIV